MSLLARSGIWTACFILLLLIGKMLYRLVRDVLTLRAIPSPPAQKIIGSVTDLLNLSKEELFYKFREYSKEYHPIYRLSYFHVDTINLTGAADIEQVLTNSVHLNRSKAYECLRNWLGTGLLTSTADTWQARRKMLAPTFHMNILQNFLLTFNEEADKMVNKMMKNLDDSGIDITKYIDHLASQSIGDAVLGLDLVDEGVMIDYRQNIQKIGKIIKDRISNIWYRNNLIWNLTPLAAEEKKVVQSLHRFSDTIIRRRKIMRRGSTVERQRSAVLDLLLKYREEGADITDEGIREEVDTCLFEGNDTVAIAICMTLLLLANHKDVQQKVNAEIESVIGKKPRPVTVDDLSKLKYLECCIKESLRLFPSVPSIGRVAGEDYVTTTGYKVPKGSIIVIHIFDLHRDATVFPEPEKFNPDRFKPENCTDRSPFTYIPFSGGSRNCIGEKFAMLELKTMVCSILQHFKLAPVDSVVDMKFYNDLILRTNNPIRIKFMKK